MTELEAFLQTHPVFSLRQFRELVGRRATPASTQARIKYHLYAVVGFYLEGEASRLFVPPEFLERLAKERPRSRIYLEPRQRGGRLQARWN